MNQESVILALCAISALNLIAITTIMLLAVIYYVSKNYLAVNAALHRREVDEIKRMATSERERSEVGKVIE